VEEGHGSGEAVAQGAQLTLLRAYAQTSFFSRKPGFLLSAMHSHVVFRWFSAAPLVFLFLDLLPLQLNQIWRIFCVMCGEECGWTLFDCLQKL
jgi:hypothetical protein